MKAGFARQVITPPLGTRMMGIYPRDAESGCTAIHDDIYVRALFFSHEGEAALVMSFDLCFLGRDDADRLKGAIGRELDLLPRQILLSATHSHVSPSVGCWHSAGYIAPDRLYLLDLEAKTLAAAHAARDTAQEATLWAGKGKSVLPMSRRLPVAGKIESAPNPDAPIFDGLETCLIKNAKGVPFAAFFSIATHPSIVRGFEISAEFPGIACDLLDEYLGAPGSLFLQGTGGDSKPTTIAVDGEWNWDAGWQEMQKTGEILANEVLQLAEKGLSPVEPHIKTALIETNWPLQPAPGRVEFQHIVEQNVDNPIRAAWANRQIEKLNKYGSVPETASVLIQGIQLGDALRLIAIEGEPVSHYGQMITDAYQKGVTFPLGYANGEAMYLVTSPMLDEGGMEPESYWEYGHPAPLAKGMEPVVAGALAELRACSIG